MEPGRKYTKLDRTFQVSLILKAADSVLEIIGGVLLLVVSANFINSTITLLTRHELSQDPQDFIANHILKATHDFANGSKYFAAFYLLSHGIVKIVIIIALFKEKMWAYPTMIVVLGTFIAYQLYRLTFKFSIGLILLTLFDMFVIWLTWQEYKKHKVRAIQKSENE
jgi:uncharacterized membrane protein